jgi:hypothetical protein
VTLTGRHEEAQARKALAKAEFVLALAKFLGGTNQARMSIALDPRMKGSQLAEIAELWRTMRQAVPGLTGYPTVEETVKVIEEFLA